MYLHCFPNGWTVGFPHRLTYADSNVGQHADYIIGSYDQRRHEVPHFNQFDPRNAVVPLMMLLASCNADVRTNVVL